MKQLSLLPELAAPPKFKVLTLWQPWATLLAYGVKQNETRPNYTTWKGTYLIHAAKSMARFQKDICQKEPFKSELEKIGITHYSQLPTGAVIGAFSVKWWNCIFEGLGGKFTTCQSDDLVAELGPKEIAFGDYGKGRYVWFGENHRVLENPIPYKNGQGYYLNFKGSAGNVKELLQR